MVKGRFYSRKQGWINIDTDVKRMRVYTSQAIEITEEYMKKNTWIIRRNDSKTTYTISNIKSARQNI